jgi:hypothetical protein
VGAFPRLPRWPPARKKWFTVGSKPNNFITATGGSIGHILAVGRSQAPYTYNAVRFNFAGTFLYRPSGTRWKPSTGSCSGSNGL